MKLFKNKKGFEVYGTFMVIFALLLVIAAVVAVVARQSSEDIELKRVTDLGDIQSSIVDADRTAQHLLFYIDQSARYAAYQSIYEFGQKGGFAEQSPCGDYYGYALWTGSEGCFPAGAFYMNKEFELLLNRYLLQYLIFDNRLPITDYGITLQQNEKLTIVGSAAERMGVPVEVGIASQEAKQDLPFEERGQSGG